ncbi:MAG TPA: ABC transporter ATP-binding protein [Candidatus Hydrogenedentes bacterium]|nr:ABC transporter ATP-binding protein [Candidatus Hydrogenedentota bacterium]
MDPIIRADKVDKVFFTRHFFSKNEELGKRQFYEKRRVHAVKEVEFSIQRGEIFGLLGPNGAGKTTLVKMLSGLIRPTAGDVYVDGLHVERYRLKVLKKIGVVLEGTRTSIWPLTPLENLAYFGNLKDVSGKILKKRSHELLDFIGLSDKKDVQVRRLSRGQKQKLAICIALIADPPVILLDEPTTGLDVQSARSIKDRIIQMTREQNKTALVTTHDMGVAQELCDRIGIIKSGELAACKPTDELLDLFSEQVYELRLDRTPPNGTLPGIKGVLDVSIEEQGEEVLCVVSIEHDYALRSEAIYEVIGRLRESGVQLRSVNLRQQNLENVFLRITGDSTV